MQKSPSSLTESDHHIILSSLRHICPGIVNSNDVKIQNRIFNDIAEGGILVQGNREEKLVERGSKGDFAYIVLKGKLQTTISSDLSSKSSKTPKEQTLEDRSKESWLEILENRLGITPKEIAESRAEIEKEKLASVAKIKKKDREGDRKVEDLQAEEENIENSKKKKYIIKEKEFKQGSTIGEREMLIPNAHRLNSVVFCEDSLLLVLHRAQYTRFLRKYS